jgi:large subunit ribosomal protein L6
MSRVGKAPIVLPQGVELSVNNENLATVKGPLGQLQQQLDSTVKVEKEDNTVVLTRKNESNDAKAKHGLYRALIANMVEGVTKGYKKSLVFKGVGYKAAMSSNKLILNVGYSHPVELEAIDGIKVEVQKNNQIDISGIDKNLVGQFAANVRNVRPVEPYHGYGIKYIDEVVMRKEGKTAK